jgi:hypothetical protein
MTSPLLSRRQALIAGAALPFLPALSATPAAARAEMLGASMPLHNRFKLGEFEVTALLAGTGTRDKPQETFAPTRLRRSLPPCRRPTSFRLI